MKKAILWIVNSWRRVMDARYNPLRFIADPSIQTYFTVVLFTMWSVYFGLLATYYFGWVNYNILMSILIHVAVILPISFTNAVFYDAERNNSKWLKRWYEN